MRIVKKLDIFILRQFTLLFAGTFFICLFIFMMQFLWRYVDDLIGKGLSMAVLGKFFFYASMTLVPISLPLALLLASLISFGNMGERLELLAMKAAGIPLIRILRPVFVFSLLISAGSFYFQNVVAPESSKQLSALLYSMRQKSPEMEIPEGQFYNEIPGYNLFVEHKDVESGMLYGVMIYSQGTNFDDTQIVLADSGKIQSTADHMHLQLTLYDGERFRNMQNTGGALDKATIPYMRETFKKEVDLIPFDNNFNVMDANLFNQNAQTKNLEKLNQGVDSITALLDTLGQQQYESYSRSFLRQTRLEDRKDSAELVAKVKEQPLDFDTLFANLSDNDRAHVARIALDQAQSGRQQTEYLRDDSYRTNRLLRTHKVERHKKFTLSLACILFFFIGAPLGAIIRKGGLGLPVVVSVIIFIFYYMVNVTGERFARSGEWDVTFGVWLSTMVLTPIGIWLTYKSNQDSAVFNIEGYQNFFRRLLGLRIHRHITRKEVIMNDPDYEGLRPLMQQYIADCAAYNQHHKLRRIPSYWRTFFHYEEDVEVIKLSERLEEFVLELSNSRDFRIIGTLDQMPILVPDAHTRPFRHPRLNTLVGILFPVGLVLWFRIWRYRLRLWHDLEQLQKQFRYIIQRIDKQKIENS
ncbi:MAG: LptF/LptG family permease [Bacteroidaceae bacterium]|nr:LptF/LptG family permease [Bacteroidaceae bacterium]